MNFKINVIFLIKPSFLRGQKSRQKFKYLENEKSFEDEIKSIFHLFWKAISEANNKVFWGDDSLTVSITSGN